MMMVAFVGFTGSGSHEVILQTGKSALCAGKIAGLQGAGQILTVGIYQDFR